MPQIMFGTPLKGLDNIIQGIRKIKDVKKTGPTPVEIVHMDLENRLLKPKLLD